MIRIGLQFALSYDIDAYGADFILNLHPAMTRNQMVRDERLNLNQRVKSRLHFDPASGNRHLRLHAEPGLLHLTYSATVELTHHFAEPSSISELPVTELPQSVIGYVYPSRYCQSDRLLKIANNEFGQLPRGYQRVARICDWVRDHVTFTSNASNANTSAVDTFIERIGVCRDFAHLMIALCRALNIPARIATGTDFGADPALGPPDFHAYVEVYLSGGWYIFDPSGTAIPMGLIRIGTGRDAADVAFAMIFGGVTSRAPLIRTWSVEDRALRIGPPRHSAMAISTDGGPEI